MIGIPVPKTGSGLVQWSADLTSVPSSRTVWITGAYLSGSIGVFTNPPTLQRVFLQSYADIWHINIAFYATTTNDNVYADYTVNYCYV
jgi:hypothetical protein